MSEYTKNGGEWLAAARSWVQSHCQNGERVTWGSSDVLEPALTIRQIEELAACVADAAASEMDALKEQLEISRKNKMIGDIKLTCRIACLERQLEEAKKG